MTGRVAIPIGPIGYRVGRNIRAIRKARGMTIADLAKAVQAEGRNLDRFALSRIEQTNGTKNRSQPRRVDVDDLVAIASALMIEPAKLLQEIVITTRVELTTHGDVE